MKRSCDSQEVESSCRAVLRAEAASPISISFACSDSYAQHLAVVMTSFIVNNPASGFVFHVLHKDITAANQVRIRALESDRVRIAFHAIDAAAFASFPLPPALEHVTREMYFRFLLPEMLADEARTIYIDVDVLCVADIRALWEVDLRGNALAAVSEGASGEWKKELIGLTDPAPYFYSGLLVMDLAAMRAQGDVRALLATTAARAKDLSWPDQDVINLVFRNRILEIPMIWDSVDKYSFIRRDVKIWHFPGALRKPWCNIWKNYTWLPYLKYLLKSPYRGNALRFVWGHFLGFFWFSYTKKGVTRYLFCGLRVWRRRL